MNPFSAYKLKPFRLSKGPKRRRKTKDLHTLMNSHKIVLKKIGVGVYYSIAEFLEYGDNKSLNYEIASAIDREHFLSFTSLREILNIYATTGFIIRWRVEEARNNYIRENISSYVKQHSTKQVFHPFYNTLGEIMFDNYSKS